MIKAAGSFGNLSLGASGASALMKASQGSSVEVEGLLSVSNTALLNAPVSARVELEVSSLKVGERLSIGDFAPDSRAEARLRHSTAKVGGNTRVGRSANWAPSSARPCWHSTPACLTSRML